MARNPHASYEASDHQRMPIIPKFTDYIANNLTTTVAGLALDARQGKILNETKLNIANVVNNLTTTLAGYALDARQGKVLDDKITSLNNSFPTYYCEAYYNVSPGANVTFTDVVKFNNTFNNVGGCYSTSTGYFTCPVNGIYMASFTYFSNEASVNQRPALYFGGKQIMTNGPYGHTLSGIASCTAGTHIYIKPQMSNYAFSMFGYSGHNLFTVALLKKI